MAKIYLINVGANTGHSRKARSPIFSDDTWIYVSFPRTKKSEKGQPYSPETLPFVRVRPGIKTHLDPDWKGLTYGDCCKNRRARALLRVQPGDILLFWALLWKPTRDGACIFKSQDKRWYLIGALRVKHVLKSGDKATGRARRNAHVWGGQVEPRDGVRVFVGSRHHSRRFSKAVDWEVGRDRGLMHQVVRTKRGKQVQWDRVPRWYSVTRSCRAILDLDCRCDRKVARLLARRIGKRNAAFDLIERV